MTRSQITTSTVEDMNAAIAAGIQVVRIDLGDEKVVSVTPETDHMIGLSVAEAEVEIARLNGCAKKETKWTEKFAFSGNWHWNNKGRKETQREMAHYAEFVYCENTYDSRTGSCTGQRCYLAMNRNVVAKMPDGVFIIRKIGDTICSPTNSAHP